MFDMKYNIQQLETELERMDHIGGLEILHNPIEPIWIETFRRMERVVHCPIELVDGCKRAISRVIRKRHRWERR